MISLALSFRRHGYLLLETSRSFASWPSGWFASIQDGYQYTGDDPLVAIIPLVGSRSAQRLPFLASRLREAIMSGRGVSLCIAASAPPFEAASSTSFLALKTATGVSGRRCLSS